MIIVNKYQTPITEELLKNLDAEHIEMFYEYMEKIPMLKRLSKPDRKYAKDLEKDSKGRIKVDICNPQYLKI